MKADFLDAHVRHWDDAETLFQAQRWANADHLYGFSAECGLKRLMQTFGMQMNPASTGPKDRADQVHADRVWKQYESYRTGHALGPTFPLPAPDPFLNWSVGQRYAAQHEFDQARVMAHRVGAGHVRTLVRQAQISGLLT